MLQSCGLVTLATSSVAADTVLLSASNVMATLTAWTTQMRCHVVSVLRLIVSIAEKILRVCRRLFTGWFFISATRFPNGTYCPPFLFECKNHVCVQPHWKCDGDNDCGDSSDEELHLCCKKKEREHQSPNRSHFLPHRIAMNNELTLICTIVSLPHSGGPV